MKNTITILALCLTACAKPTDGKNGADGSRGPSGNTGHSVAVMSAAASSSQCINGGYVMLFSIDTNDNSLVDDDNPTSITVCNGENGAVAPSTPVDYINPCDGTTIGEEVMLILADGSILSSFSETIAGKNTRLAIVSDGDYTTTDGTSCVFHLSTSLGIRTLAWTGGSKSWAYLH